MKELLVKQFLLSTCVVLLIAALVYFSAGGLETIAALLGGSLAVCAHLIAAMMIGFGGNSSAGSVFARTMAAELSKATILIVGFAAIFWVRSPLLDLLPVVALLREGLSAIILVASCVVVVIVNAFGGMILVVESQADLELVRSLNADADSSAEEQV